MFEKPFDSHGVGSIEFVHGDDVRHVNLVLKDFDIHSRARIQPLVLNTNVERAACSGWGRRMRRTQRRGRGTRFLGAASGDNAQQRQSKHRSKSTHFARLSLRRTPSVH